MLKAKSSHLKAPIRAVAFMDRTFIWGEGNLVHISGIQTIRIPNHARIINLIPILESGTLYIVTEFELFYVESIESLQCEIVPIPTRSRILAVLEETDLIWIVNAHGIVHLFKKSDSYTPLFVNSFELNDFSAVFYSAAIKRKTDGLLEITFGTIFSGLLVCQLDDKSMSFSIIQTLSGHKGTVFGVKYHQIRDDLLVSCSDDRSIIIWTRRSDGMFEIFKKCLGHEARVWLIDLSDNFIASASEDNTCRIWSIEGDLIRVIESDPHSKSVWAVAIDETNGNIAIGSNDSSLVVHPLKESSKCIVDKLELPECEFGSIKNIISSACGRCFAVTSKDLLLEISTGGYVKVVDEINGIGKFPALACHLGYIYVADDCGSLYKLSLENNSKVEKLFMLDSETKILKIFSSLDRLLIETAGKGYFIYNTNSAVLENLDVKPQTKVTSFCVWRSDVFIGTRAGELLIFSKTGIYSKNIIPIAENESIKSITIPVTGRISCLDRSGYEHVLANSYNCEFFEHKKVSKGALEGCIADGLFYSFFDQYFVIFSESFGCIEKIQCGGGHRLWSFNSVQNQFCFSFMSNGKLSVYQGPLDKVKLLSSPTHGKEIRCAKVVHCNALLSGSEDGLLALRCPDAIIHQYRLLNTSIKCISTVRFPKDSEIEKYIFVGGSNEAVHLLYLNKGRFANVPEFRSKHIKDLETRVLCIDAVQNDSNIIDVAVSYSDASIRLFEFDLHSRSFDLKVTLRNVHFNRCVQHVRICCSGKMLASFGNDGFVRTWQYINDALQPMHSLKIHESGINCVDFRTLPETDIISIVTGGEDGSVTNFNIYSDGSFTDVSTKSVHTSGVTGAKFYDNNRFISVSTDRRVYFHKLNSIGEIESQFLTSTVISDISAVELTSKDGNDELTVFGAGYESFQIY